jgi:hypothetical protein
VWLNWEGRVAKLGRVVKMEGWVATLGGTDV